MIYVNGWMKNRMVPPLCIKIPTSRLQSDMVIMVLQGLNKRQIEVISETSRDRYKVRIFCEQGDLWQVTITLTDSLQIFHVLTSRGELKTWRELSAAICYIQETCPNCRMVAIEVGKWRFSRSELD